MITLGPEHFKFRTRCPLCHGAASRTLGRTLYQRLHETPRGLIQLNEQVRKDRILVQCLSCGLAYNRLIPKSETLDFLYNVPADQPTWKFDTSGRRMKEKLGFLALLPTDTSLRVLDIGCYTGGFLAMLPEHWTKHGLDPNPKALSVAKQQIPLGQFRTGHLENIDASQAQYDLVTLWDVAEHLDDVDSAFKKIASLLTVGGLLVMETGDTDSTVARLMRQGWYYANYIEHFCFFSEDVFRRTLPRYGLRVIACTETLHHYDSNKALSIKAHFWAYFAATLGGRVSTFWLALSKLLNRRGASYPPVSPDHILLTAQKVLRPGSLASQGA